tara:strand:+ start:732 stop:1244 length:513 start_codon:yes stop_codon:yes gene_type:complete
MALFISNENKNEIIKEGNPFFNDLINIMNNYEFKIFFNKYFTDWNEIQTMVFFMKLHSTIEYEFTRQFNTKIDKSEMEIILNKVMENNTTRKMALSLFNDYKQCTDYKNTEKFRSLLSFSNFTKVLPCDDSNTYDNIYSFTHSIVSSIICSAITNITSEYTKDCNEILLF